jgi:uncharacterized protein YktA (UPF0223 family)
MSIIIQAGHKTSKSKEVMAKLYERGLSRPSDSYTHKMTTEQVSETLYKVLVRENMSSANEKMADNVMTDFLLANLDFEDWGWESDKNLAGLEYWQQIEPDVGFVLVFDHPRTIFEFSSINTLTVKTLNQRIEDWVEYNQSLLDFYDKNQDKCILIEGYSALKNIASLKEQVKKIANTLELKSSWQVASINTSITKEQSADSGYNILLGLIAEEALTNYPEVITLFNKLLSKASIKESDSIFKTKRIGVDKLVSSLNTIGLQQEKTLSIEKEAQLKYESLERALREQQSKSKKHSDNTILQSNQVIVEQLLQTQEELERLYQEESNKKKQQSNAKKPETPKKRYGAAEAIKADLPYKLGSVLVSAKKPDQIAKLPITLMKEYKAFEKKSGSLYSPLKLDEYEDAREAEKVKNHLSYQLGKVMLDSKQSPKKLISLPLNMGKIIVGFKKNK